MDDLHSLTDNELEDIVRKGVNLHIGGSQAAQAQNELNYRYNKKHEEAILKAEKRLDKIISLLEYIGKKPIRSVLLAFLFSLLVAALANVLSAWVIILLRIH